MIDENEKLLKNASFSRSRGRFRVTIGWTASVATVNQKSLLWLFTTTPYAFMSSYRWHWRVYNHAHTILLQSLWWLGKRSEVIGATKNKNKKNHFQFHSRATECVCLLFGTRKRVQCQRARSRLAHDSAPKKISGTPIWPSKPILFPTLTLYLPLLLLMAALCFFHFFSSSSTGGLRDERKIVIFSWSAASLPTSRRLGVSLINKSHSREPATLSSEKTKLHLLSFHSLSLSAMAEDIHRIMQLLDPWSRHRSAFQIVISWNVIITVSADESIVKELLIWFDHIFLILLQVADVRQHRLLVPS